MLKLTVSPGEYLTIGSDVKIIFAGGSREQIPIVVDAPKEKSIIRSAAKVKRGVLPGPGNEIEVYREKAISDKAKEKIKAIVKEERKRAKRERKKQQSPDPLRKYGGGNG